MTHYGEIIGWGAYTPSRVLSNRDLEVMVDTSDEWIRRRTGIEERRIAEPHETTATMSIAAGRRALARASLQGTDLDLIIVATSSPDHLTPPVSSQIQHALGATDVPAFVLVTGCTGFLYALATAYQFIGAGTARNVLVIGAEMITRHINWQDRATCVLFGDAAGAVIIQATEAPCGLLAFRLGSDGSGAGHIIIPAGGTAEPANHAALDSGRQFVQMNGPEVFRFASRIVGAVSREVLNQAGLTFEDIDWIIPHQANLRIIQAAARDMQLPLERFVINIQRYGNTSAASIPLALSEALDSGQVKPTDRLLLVSFGAGLTWAATLLQMAPAPAWAVRGRAVNRSAA